MKWYKLNDDHSVTEISYDELVNNFTTRPKHVGDDTVDGQRVSTVFLSLDHNWDFDSNIPILFETMIFGGEYSEEMWRYSTYQEALDGHTRIVNCLKEGINPNH